MRFFLGLEFPKFTLNIAAIRTERDYRIPWCIGLVKW